MKQINNFANWADTRNTEVLIGEWGADSQIEAVTFLKAFKANDFGWTAHSWKKSGSGGLGSSLYDSGSQVAYDSTEESDGGEDMVYWLWP